MLEFGIASDLYTAGARDDGTPFIAEQYYILATDETGRRWRHYAMFNGCHVMRCYLDMGEDAFTDIRTSAQVRAQILLDRIIAAGGVIAMQYWDETFPEYGSDAYMMDPGDLGDAEYY
jgi:hypothetical protein